MKFGKYDVEERPHSTGTGVQCLIFFPNGYGASIVRFHIPLSFSPGRKVGSYGVDKDLWEMAVLKGTEEGWSLTYGTPVTDDVIGYLSEDEVGKYLEQVEDLPQRSTKEVEE